MRKSVHHLYMDDQEKNNTITQLLLYIFMGRNSLQKKKGKNKHLWEIHSCGNEVA